METTLGGDRLGSGNKQVISYKNYERSTHDLSETWRSTMSAGTLVPFLKKVGLPGDTFDIDLNCEVLTLPTVGPLFGSYKVQLDVFEVPVRLYNAALHMNKLGIGMDMKNIYLPQLTVYVNNHTNKVHTFEDNEQIDPSSILKYLGISGVGRLKNPSSGGWNNPATRKFNAVPFLAYWDIYKNYYANKQEEKGYFIHTPGTPTSEGMTPISAVYDPYNLRKDLLAPASDQANHAIPCHIQFLPEALEPDLSTIEAFTMDIGSYTFDDVCESYYWDPYEKRIVFFIKQANEGLEISVKKIPYTPKAIPAQQFGISSFPLSNIDDEKLAILRYPVNEVFGIDETHPYPYGALYESNGVDENLKFAYQNSQEGLALKTYQSDLFNNWINTEWIDGENGVTELSKVLVSENSFTIDALNISQKVYAMMNRIAISGGTYDDWLDAVYTHERVKSVESPIYMGSLIKEIAFQEVISLTPTEEKPLGTLAGRGVLTHKHKGGKIIIKVNEPSYILGIVSITPRLDYSQGNDWDMNLKSMDDFHKPAMDAIGFQDLITDQLCWSDTQLNADTDIPVFKSLGKQPAWINYMTSVNKTFGNFAKADDSMFMTLNRKYSKTTNGELADPTTYIDPSKFNNIFAETSLDSQNFWVQIASNITARRKMSAKVIPNL